MYKVTVTLLLIKTPFISEKSPKVISSYIIGILKVQRFKHYNCHNICPDNSRNPYSSKYSHCNWPSYRRHSHCPPRIFALPIKRNMKWTRTIPDLAHYTFVPYLSYYSWWHYRTHPKYCLY